jgi:hypothetical protein
VHEHGREDGVRLSGRVLCKPAGHERPLLNEGLSAVQLDEEKEDTPGSTVGMSAEELQKLIEAGVDLRIKQGYGSDLEGLGMYISDLLGKLPQDQLDEIRELLDDGSGSQRARPRRTSRSTSSSRSWTLRTTRRCRLAFSRRSGPLGCGHIILPAAPDHVPRPWLASSSRRRSRRNLPWLLATRADRDLFFQDRRTRG